MVRENDVENVRLVPEAGDNEAMGGQNPENNSNRRSHNRLLQRARGKELAKTIGKALREMAQGRRDNLRYAIQAKIGGKCWRITADPTLDIDSPVARNWRGVEQNGPILTFDTREEAEQWLIMFRLRNNTQKGRVLQVGPTVAGLSASKGAPSTSRPSPTVPTPGRRKKKPKKV